MNTTNSARPTRLASLLPLLVLALAAPATPVRAAQSVASPAAPNALCMAGDADQDDSDARYIVKFGCNEDTNSTTIHVYDGNTLIGTYTLQNYCLNAVVAL